MDFSGKKIVIGLCGGIAIYKTASIVRRLTHDYTIDVYIVMTKAAQEFMTPLIFETFTKKPVVTTMFPKNRVVGTEHIDLAQESDLIVAIPATGNIIGKAANGIADEMLSTVIAAGIHKTMIVPAMNTEMWNNPIVQTNIQKLKEIGVQFINPVSGDLACNTYGIGHIEDETTIVEQILRAVSDQSLKQKTVLITGGPTSEKIDPVRMITNPSSGKTGVTLAREAYLRGADVILVSGKTDCNIPKGVKHIAVNTADEMNAVVQENLEKSDIVLFSAAVEDYKPANVSNQKIKKKNSLTVDFTRTVDVLQQASQHKGNQIFVGYSVETENAISNSKEKMITKKCDIMVVNSPQGFQGDRNSVCLLATDGTEVTLENCTKADIATEIFNMVLRCF